MDIKVLKNFDVSRAWFVNKNLVLSVRNREDKKLGGFVCQELMLINPDSNEKADVEPQLDKYLTENVIYACGNRDYIVFPTLYSREDGTAVITWYLHKCYEGQSKQLHSVSFVSYNAVACVKRTVKHVVAHQTVDFFFR